MTFSVTTTQGKHEFSIATDYKIRQAREYEILIVMGDDDWEDGPKALRRFNMDHVVDYGWEKFTD